ncbi:uncharacterized [Tachysurus ichikawai]
MINRLLERFRSSSDASHLHSLQRSSNYSRAYCSFIEEKLEAADGHQTGVTGILGRYQQSCQLSLQEEA